MLYTALAIICFTAISAFTYKIEGKYRKDIDCINGVFISVFLVAFAALSFIGIFSVAGALPVTYDYVVHFIYLAPSELRIVVTFFIMSISVVSYFLLAVWCGHMLRQLINKKTFASS